MVRSTEVTTLRLGLLRARALHIYARARIGHCIDVARPLIFGVPSEMHVFSAKLDDISKSIALVLSANVDSLAAALSSGGSKFAIAVGSGGSAISAAYLRVCRNSLGQGPTLVQTPMEFVLGSEGISDAQVWLFSAGGSNPDILAARSAAIARGASAIHVVTNNARGDLARSCEESKESHLHVLPVADPKDGFLATHSLMSTVSALLAASDRISNHPVGCMLADSYLTEAEKVLAEQNRSSLAETFASFRRSDTILLLLDPRLAPAGLLIETSVWEAGLCEVQQTDHRNFAHGRHVWLEKRPAETFLISLTGSETDEIWKDIERLVPYAIRRLSIGLGNCGRLQNALGILWALTIVEAIGRATDVDPGKPGVGTFARDIYNSPFLRKLSEELSPAVRHKQAALLSRDDPKSGNVNLLDSFSKLKTRVASSSFAGIVLDYDGTIVSTEGRYDPPGDEVVDELNRLLEEGLPLAIATGRGGSAGEMLREVLSEKHHATVLLGYYNGAYIRTLDIDIRIEPAPAHPAIGRVVAWFDDNPDLFKQYKLRNSGVQVAVEIEHLSDVAEFEARFASDFDDVPGLRLSRSAHTIDIGPVEVCKTNVVKALAHSVNAPAESILCIGDSGAPYGNDYALLGMPCSISVDQVCWRPDVCWSFFGRAKVGPQALLHILRSFRRETNGRMTLDVDALSNSAI